MCNCPCAGLELWAFADRWCSGLCVLEEFNARLCDTYMYIRTCISCLQGETSADQQNEEEALDASGIPGWDRVDAGPRHSSSWMA